MIVLKPMIKYGILSWAKPMVCSLLVDKFFALLNITSDIDNKFDICQEGVDMYFEHFYFAGREEDTPLILTYGPKGNLGNP